MKNEFYLKNGRWFCNGKTFKEMYINQQQELGTFITQKQEAFACAIQTQL